MREIFHHKSFLQDDMDKVRVFATDEPGAGNACHKYYIDIEDSVKCESRIKFQEGPLLENTPNGCSNEAVMAVVIDRLKGFQAGQFACRENEMALIHLEQALMWLQRRTRSRIQRGVEGKNEA